MILTKCGEWWKIFESFSLFYIEQRIIQLQTTGKDKQKQLGKWNKNLCFNIRIKIPWYYWFFPDNWQISYPFGTSLMAGAIATKCHDHILAISIFGIISPKNYSVLGLFQGIFRFLSGHLNDKMQSELVLRFWPKYDWKAQEWIFLFELSRSSGMMNYSALGETKLVAWPIETIIHMLSYWLRDFGNFEKWPQGVFSRKEMLSNNSAQSSWFCFLFHVFEVLLLFWRFQCFVSFFSVLLAGRLTKVFIDRAIVYTLLWISKTLSMYELIRVLLGFCRFLMKL